MSIEIIGSGGNKLKLVTEDKIESIINENEITYNLYKSKYKLTTDNKLDDFCNESNNHLLKQLMKSFYKYDDTLKFNHNLENFKKFLLKLQNTSDIIEYINIFYNQNNILSKLNNAITKIIKKIIKRNHPGIQINYIELNNNYYLDLLMLQHILYEQNINNDEFKEYINILDNNIKLLIDFLNKISIIKLKINNYITFDNNCLEKSKQIIDILDLYIENIKFIKGNILKIDSFINIIIENIYKFYNYLE